MRRGKRFLIRLGPVERKILVTSRKILLGASRIQNTKVKVENVTSAIGTTVITVMERGKHVGILLALSSSDDEDDESSDEDISNVITSVLLIS